MSITREEAHKLVDEIFDLVAGEEHEGPIEPVDISKDVEVVNDGNFEVEAIEARVLPEGKKVVRTKSSGDRVYYLDEEKKTRQWVTNPEVLVSLGFEITDVVEIEDSELLKYQMGPAIYRVQEDE